jgi:hypothetical protein
MTQKKIDKIKNDLKKNGVKFRSVKSQNTSSLAIP